MTKTPHLSVPLVDERGMLSPHWVVPITSFIRHQLNVVSTAGGNVSIALPSAKENFYTEWIYKKSSADGNTLTITGAQDGNQVLSAQYAKARFKSDGVNWWVV